MISDIELCIRIMSILEFIPLIDLMDEEKENQADENGNHRSEEEDNGSCWWSRFISWWTGVNSIDDDQWDLLIDFGLLTEYYTPFHLH